jgi:hypothetical protein
MTTSNHRKQVAISLLRCANPAMFRRWFFASYNVICPDGKVFSTLRDASLALGYRPGTLRTLRSQAGGPSRMTLRGLTATFLD